MAPRARLALLFAAFAVLSVTVYRDALRGPFVSDDIGYILNSPYTRELSAESLARIADPFGDARLFTANYAPVHLALTALERQIFADDVFGYHLVNVLLHALNATLLAALFVSSGLSFRAAAAGAGLFLLHPANVEAVAWISQLKTVGALTLSLGALLALSRHPLAGALLFGLALLTKASAAFALPVAATLTFARSGGPRDDPRAWGWLALWTALFGLYAVPQMSSFGMRGEVEVAAFADAGVHLRTIAAIGMRYLVMAATSWGVSAFAEPEPVVSWLDPWFLAALPAGALLARRTWIALRRRSEEAAYWVAAAASFVPVSQAFPFLIPMADRYLYFILPGLIGGVLLAGVALLDRVPSERRVIGAFAGTAVALALFFGWRSSLRAPLWTNETLLHLDAARHYPEGGTAKFLGARRAAQEGDAETAVALLREASAKGIDRFMILRTDPGLAPIRSDPAFRELVRETAGRFIERSKGLAHQSQPELRMVAYAHLEREEYAEAESVLERALAVGGPLDDTVRTELAQVRALRSQDQGDGHRPQGP